MSTERLRQVYFPSQSPEVLATFFEEVLGLEPQFRDGDRWIQFRAGDVSVAVASEEEATGTPEGSAVPVFEVSDLDAMVASATAAGAEAGTIRDMGAHGRTALLVLPGGAHVSLFART